jgi:hypothetical protein
MDGKNSDPGSGMEQSHRHRHPGSATLVVTVIFIHLWYGKFQLYGDFVTFSRVIYLFISLYVYFFFCFLVFFYRFPIVEN